jgi:DNA-binding protein HU-beta
VNKAELVARVARETGLPKALVLRVLDAVLETVGRSLRRGDKVTLVDFGTFLVTRRRARAGYDPHAGQPMRIAARKWPRFAPGRGLRALVR